MKLVKQSKPFGQKEVMHTLEQRGEESKPKVEMSFIGGYLYSAGKADICHDVI